MPDAVSRPGARLSARVARRSRSRNAKNRGRAYHLARFHNNNPKHNRRKRNRRRKIHSNSNNLSSRLLSRPYSLRPGRNRNSGD